MGVVGYHPALLPENRGRHPLIWAIVLGLKQTGSTFFFMDEGADTGDLLSQEVVEISEGMNSQKLYDQITITSITQIEKFLPELQSSTYTKIAQDHTKANSWRKRSKTDGILDFRISASKIHQLILALSKPYIGAHLVYKLNDVKVWESKEIKKSKINDEPGKVLKSDRESIIIKCGENAIELLRHEFKSLPEIGEYLQYNEKSNCNISTS
jgi:methionyl-tRNA formyltransferase